jgi:hypothetical protein
MFGEPMIRLYWGALAGATVSSVTAMSALLRGSATTSHSVKRVEFALSKKA